MPEPTIQGRGNRITQCLYCGQKFRHYQKSRKFCSRRCMNEWKKAANRITTTCPQCGKEFWYLESWPRKYCSNRCSGIANYGNLGRHAAGESVELACEYCGKVFTRNLFEAQKTKRHFCSRKCFGKWLSQHHPRGKNHPSYAGRIERTCKHCGRKFETFPAWAKRGESIFCSKECYSTWQSGRPSTSTSPATLDEHRRRNYGPDWKQQRNKARQRDNYTCRLCNITENELEKQLDVHHIVPFKEFGLKHHKEANQLDNLICLCPSCHLALDHESGNRPAPYVPQN